MKSAGNDIVALNAINIQRTNDSRFYSKFVTPTELALYQSALPFETFVWLLWSAKEAAYKYWQRHNSGLTFSPGKLIVTAINIPPDFNPTPYTSSWENGNTNELFVTGTITNGEQQLHYRSKIHTNVLANIVNADEDFENVHWGIEQIEQTDSEAQSAAARAFALNRLQATLKTDDLSIAKSEVGYPVILNNSNPVDMALSFTHHEDFVGYSFII